MQSVSLPPKTLMWASASATLDHVLAGEGEPVGVRALAAHRQRAHPAALGDDVGLGERAIELEALVDVGEDEAPVLRGDLGVGALDPGVGGADAGARAHGDDEEEAPVVGEEGEHPPVGREAIDDEVDALGEGVVGARRLPGERVVRVDEGPAGVDQDPGPHGEGAARDHVARVDDPHPTLPPGARGLDVVGRRAPVVQRAPDEVPHEAGVVVVEVGVGVLEAAVAAGELEDGLLAPHGGEREAARPPGEEAADEPVEPGAEDELPQAVAEAALVGGVEADLLDSGGVAQDEVVPRLAQLADEPSSKLSMYLMPPQARLLDAWLVKPAKSPRSMSATFAPLAERDAAETAPLMPPPRTRTSKVPSPSLPMLVSRSAMPPAAL